MSSVFFYIFFFKVLDPTKLTAGYSVPHLLVRRPARSHSWSNVIDRVLESSTKSDSVFSRCGVTRIRRIERKILFMLMPNVNSTMLGSMLGSIIVYMGRKPLATVGDL